MNYLLFIITLLISSIAILWAMYYINLLKFMSVHKKVPSNIRSVSFGVYAVVSIYIWLLWSVFGAGLAFYFMPINSNGWLYYIPAYFCISIILRLCRGFYEETFESAYESGEILEYSMSDFTFLSLATVTAFLGTVFYPDCIPGILSWLNYLLF
ncbi:MAG: hypothetical protein ACPGVB_07000 [Chitinophagales bacterium]